MDNYRIIQIVGSGTFGTVYLVKDDRANKFALKKVQINPFNVDEAIQEVEILKKIHHQNLIKIHEAYRNDNEGKLEILMEFCQEGDLLSYLNKRQNIIPTQEILTIFQQVVKAFLALNSQGIIHRDLKPENVFLTSNKIVKIADFGCAKDDQFSAVRNSSFDKGTLIYAAPEQINGEPYSSKCDVWSAGCLLYYLYFGEHLFQGANFEEILNKVSKFMEEKEVNMFFKNIDQKIQHLLKLTLVYKEKQRASWKELDLCRIFHPRISNINNFLIYLESISNIANWILIQFWKVKKQVQICKDDCYLFAYFMAKVQYTSLQMAIFILNKAENYSYLFQAESYKKFDGKNHHLRKDICNVCAQKQNYFQAISDNLVEKDVYKFIQLKESKRKSFFCDLAHSIRISEKMLKILLPNLQRMENPPNIFGVMAKWVNFEEWFGFEKKPKIEEFMNGNQNVSNFIKEELTLDSNS